VVQLIAAKFEPFVFSVLSFALANVANMYMFMILYDFLCCLPSFVTESYMCGILNATCKSRVGMRLGKLPAVRRILFCGHCHFKRCLSAENSQARQQ
jgi:hypothetical protein